MAGACGSNILMVIVDVERLGSNRLGWMDGWMNWWDCNLGKGRERRVTYGGDGYLKIEWHFADVRDLIVGGYYRLGFLQESKLSVEVDILGGY